MKIAMVVVSALICVFLATPPAAASGKCVYEGYDEGSADVLKFVKWEFGKSNEGKLMLNVTLHNNLKQPIKWFDLSMLVNGRSISLKMRQTLPPESDALITAKYGMSDSEAAEFHASTPLICVQAIEDANGNHQSYE